MKAEINENRKGFEPIEVKITIESMDELVTLVSQLNASSNDVLANTPTDIKHLVYSDCVYKNWQKLGEPLLEIAKQRNK